MHGRQSAAEEDFGGWSSVTTLEALKPSKECSNGAEKLRLHANISLRLILPRGSWPAGWARSQQVWVRNEEVALPQAGGRRGVLQTPRQLDGWANRNGVGCDGILDLYASIISVVTLAHSPLLICCWTWKSGPTSITSPTHQTMTGHAQLR